MVYPRIRMPPLPPPLFLSGFLRFSALIRAFSLQISTLISHRERPLCSDRSLRAVARVGQAVNLAVERFVTVGETIADDNPEIKQDMYEACKEARVAGEYTRHASGMTLEASRDTGLFTMQQSWRSESEVNHINRIRRMLKNLCFRGIVLAWGLTLGDSSGVRFSSQAERIAIAQRKCSTLATLAS